MSRQREDLLDFDVYTIDVGQRVLLSRGTPVPLSPKVFDTLLALAEEPGRVLEKDYLLKKIWPDTFVEEGSLARNVSMLRRVLGKSPEDEEYIETIPKRGYRFKGAVRRVSTTHTAPAGSDRLPEVAAVLEREPNWSALPGTAPANVLKLLRPSLRIDAERRLRDVAEARLELEEETPVRQEELGGQRRVTESERSTRRLMAAVIGVSAVLLAGGLSWFFLDGARNEPQVLRIDLSPPTGSTFALMSALSPDGRLLAFVAQSHGVSKLWMRPLDSPNAHEIPGSEGARWPFWSPDSRSIGFFGSGKLLRAEIAGGQPTPICDVPAGAGASWSQNGTIIFNAVNDGPLMRVAASGGVATQLTTLDPAHENSHRLPIFLPDGNHFLFFVRADRLEDDPTQGIYLASLDRPQEKRRIVTSRRHGVYAPGIGGRPGHLLWVRNNQLVAQPFDAVRLTLSGEPVPVADISEIGLGSGPSPVSASAEDSLVYGTPPDNRYQVTWYSRDGKALEAIGAPDLFFEAAISPDGQQIAAFRVDPTRRGGAGAGDYWLLDLKRRVPSRVTFGGANHFGVSWASDSSRVAYVDASGPPNVWMQDVTGNARARRLTTSHDSQQDPDLSPDGRFLLYTENHNDPSSRTRSDLELLSLDENHTIEPYLQTPFAETKGRFSPDGRWVSYTSDESGRNEIYVQSFPIGSLKFRVSNEGGDSARWRRDGKELFYTSPNNTLMAVAVTTVPEGLEFGIPQMLFMIPGRLGIYDISPDGQRVLALPPASDKASPSITIVVNWSALLNKVP